MPADDVHKFQHDLERTFDYFHAQFHPSAYYISAQGFYQQDGIQIYKDMKKHFQGHQGNDILRQILILMQFRINPNLSIQEDVARLHRIFQDLDYTLGHEFEFEVKLAIFLAHVQFDKRPGASHYICNLKFAKVSYEIGVDYITSPVAIGATTPHHTMKALGSTPNTAREYCRKWAAGVCTHGAACKYIHKLDPKAPASAPNATKPYILQDKPSFQTC
jgi:Zinc finger C-x8-C-x5-C-x3-H type (and similar)